MRRGCNSIGTIFNSNRDNVYNRKSVFMSSNLHLKWCRKGIKLAMCENGLLGILLHRALFTQTVFSGLFEYSSFKCKIRVVA